MGRLISFLLVYFSCLAIFAQGQNITLKANNKALFFVLQEIKSQTGAEFYYSSDVVDVNQKVSVKFEKVTLADALKKLFASTAIAYSVQGNQVLLFKNPNYKIVVSGYLREFGTGELLIGATVSTKPAYAGCVTNAYGFYSLIIPADSFTLLYNYVGYNGVEKKPDALPTQQINVTLTPNTALKETEVKAKSNTNEVTLNRVVVPLHEINQVPMILGEKDVVKYIMLSPGVQKGNEGNAYMYVRGGGPDQNLVLIDDAVIYNAYHFLGLASLFSGNELKHAELIKGGFSSKYGGRLSSVLDMSMKDGNREKYGAEATIGVISSRVMVEGPLVKDKASFLISYRKSYLNQTAALVSKNQDEMLDYNYYDLHAKLSTNIGTKNRLMLSGYLGKDVLANNTAQGLTSEEDGIKWGNKAASLRWNYQANNRLFATTSLVYSYYATRIAFGAVDEALGKKSYSAVQSSITDFTLKSDFDYLLSAKHKFKFGAGLTQHTFNAITTLSNEPNEVDSDSNTHVSPEAFLYAEWQYILNPKFSFTAGLRWSYFYHQKSYNGIEPRLNLSYKPNKNIEFSASYAFMYQYLHLISAFNGLGLPSDAWVTSNQNLAPQSSQMFTLGFLKNHVFTSKLAFSIEVYGKKMNNATALKEGASFFQVLPVNGTKATASTWEDLATQGNANSFGAEFMLKKYGDRFHGHISYTLSKTTMQFDELNNGKSFLASYDRTHDLGFFVGLKAGKRFLFSVNWVYGTGNLISMPTAKYYVEEPNSGGYLGENYYYESKNNYRVQSYHRLDFSMQYQFKIGTKLENTLEFSVYNVYNRANPFYYELNTVVDGTTGLITSQNLQKISLFPVMPSLSWGVKF